MGIQKQQFYEGAALHILARAGNIMNIRYDAPFFLLNNKLQAFLKYSTKVRSPWGFTFTSDEQALLKHKSSKFEIVIGLICGSDGIAAFTYDDYRTVAASSKSALHIACYRQHGEHYQVKGPDGILNWKVPPSNWQRTLGA